MQLTIWFKLEAGAVEIIMAEEAEELEALENLFQVLLHGQQVLVLLQAEHYQFQLQAIQLLLVQEELKMLQGLILFFQQLHLMEEDEEVINQENQVGMVDLVVELLVNLQELVDLETHLHEHLHREKMEETVPLQRHILVQQAEAVAEFLMLVLQDMVEVDVIPLQHLLVEMVQEQLLHPLVMEPQDQVHL
jgi:hypothetical protein